ncbi:phage integrase central domain-containing protein [Caballeronia sp. LZ035]|uniref:tyrosine-type recombinase/integrase n=1 Tax=Caballeronia sp. LZ035 TaxID=3038568 RepID=UPI0028662048|nr:integrase arm-type DNA-binding domain-containing protein [Caballeronia sp. LZ035]MDR5758211.1 tyrosine-type recombinase/integrase [Caballeronia sp. LZ035]
MPRIVKPLTDAQLKNAKAREKPYKLSDGGGLYIAVTPEGSKLWRLKYRFNGMERTTALGAYPTVTLIQARDKRNEARGLLSDGKDPLTEKRAAQAKEGGRDSFKAIAEEWIEKQSNGWSKKYAQTVKNRLKGDAYSKIGHLPAGAIRSADVLDLIAAIEKRKAFALAIKIHQLVSKVLQYAVITGRAERNIAADVRGALTPVQTEHLAAVTAEDDLKDLLARIDAYGGSPWTRYALNLLAHTFLRPSAMLGARWGEVDTDARVWSVPATRMKMRRDHIVPLTDATVAIFEALRTIRGKSEFVFPNHRTDNMPMGASALHNAMRNICDGKTAHTPHGFRSTASTLLHEKGYNSDVIEAQLAHKRPGVRGIYHRGEYLAERREMMAFWSNYLVELVKANP